MGKPRKRPGDSPAVKAAAVIKRKYLQSPRKPSRCRRAILATEQEKVSRTVPGPSCPPPDKPISRHSSANTSCTTTNIVIENSVIKGYHAFKIKPPKTVPSTKLYVDREYTNINDKDACLVWIPDISTFDKSLHNMITDEQRNLYLSDIAGLPIGHVPRILASCFYELLDDGADIYATATSDPVQSFPPWPAPSEKGGGAVIPCSYTIVCRDIPKTVKFLNNILSLMTEGSVMNVKVVE